MACALQEVDDLMFPSGLKFGILAWGLLQAVTYTVSSAEPTGISSAAHSLTNATRDGLPPTQMGKDNQQYDRPSGLQPAPCKTAEARQPPQALMLLLLALLGQSQLGFRLPLALRCFSGLRQQRDVRQKQLTHTVTRKGITEVEGHYGEMEIPLTLGWGAMFGSGWS